MKECHTSGALQRSPLFAPIRAGTRSVYEWYDFRVHNYIRQRLPWILGALVQGPSSIPDTRCSIQNSLAA